jgi:hypothetical protein
MAESCKHHKDEPPSGLYYSYADIIRRRQRKLKLYGKWMYERSDIPDLIKLVEHGFLKLGNQGGLQVTGCFSLEQWREAWDLAVEEAGFGKMVVIQP